MSSSKLVAAAQRGAKPLTPASHHSCTTPTTLPTPGTGGAGRWHGGDGVVRELEFLRPLTASILSERRSVAPFGLLGGAPGAKGLNLWVQRDGRLVSLGGKATVQVQGGDRLRILTPGGGGYGPLSAAAEGDAAAGEVRGTAAAGTEEAAAAADEAALVDRKLASKRQRAGSGEFSAPVRDGGSVQQYTRAQETV